MRNFILFFVAILTMLFVGCQNPTSNATGIEDNKLPEVTSVKAPGSKVLQISFDGYDQEIYEFYKYMKLDGKILSSEIEEGNKVNQTQDNNNIICEYRFVRTSYDGNSALSVLNVVFKNNITIGPHLLLIDNKEYFFVVEKDETPPIILSVELIAKSVAQYSFS